MTKKKGKVKLPVQFEVDIKIKGGLTFDEDWVEQVLKAIKKELRRFRKELSTRDFAKDITKRLVGIPMPTIHIFTRGKRKAKKAQIKTKKGNK